MSNFINLSITKLGGDTVTAFNQLFDPSKMQKIRLNSTSDGIAFQYEGEGYESTSVTTIDGVQSLINLAAPSGTRTYIGVFDPSANAGQRAIAAHNLLDVNGNAIVLPDNSRVWDGYYEVATTFTSATDAATISIGIPTDDAAGILAAAAISTGTTWDAGAPKAIIQVGTIAAISEKTTAARNVVMTVASEVLLTGKVYVYLEVVTTPS